MINSRPVFPSTGKYSWGTLTAANTNKDGTGTVLAFAAAGADGKRVDKIIAKPLGTNVASLARIFINNGGDNNVANNNSFIKDWPLPAYTNSETAASPQIEIPLDKQLENGWRILVVIATAVAAGWRFTEEAGDMGAANVA